MVAIGFFIMVAMAILYKSKPEYYWVEHKKYQQFVEAMFTLGGTLMILGFTLFLWRTFP